MKLEVGCPFPPGLPPDLEAGGAKSIVSADGHLSLLLADRQLADAAIKAVQGSRIDLGLLDAGRHTALLLWRIAGYATWSDAPIQAGLTRDLVDWPTPAPRQGQLVSVILVEGPQAIVRVLRVVSVSPPWATALAQLIQAQIAARADLTTAVASAEIEAAYRRGSSAMLVHQAMIVEQAGLQATFDS